MNITDKKYQDIVAYISGELTEKEKADFDLWLEVSEENKKAYQQVLRKVLYTRWSLKSTQVNTEFEFTKFENRINTRVRYLSFAAVAAGIILLLSISIPFLLNTGSKETPAVAQLIEIEPGERGAELILSTGVSVKIEAATKEIKELDGSLIQIDSLRGIEYTVETKLESKEIYNTLKVSRGQEFDILLADGTRVWLNAESELRYPVQFIGDRRQVYLKGEAYFDVAANKEKVFVVNSYGQQVKVYGTEFCVNAYDQNKIETVLVEGSVGLRVNSTSAETKLKPGELGLANLQTGEVNVNEVNVRPYIAWKDGEFVFENAPLENIMERLERWYDVKVFFMNEECKTYRFTADMQRYADVKDFLFFMETTSNAKFEIKKNAIVVMAK
ncbi:DUF4974 domain-containing protein [Ancylomarina sp. DW003]|nr:FecR family protein [Ancylomarina sp. DW003]MDE5422140.1 DUF4974 domain-containing protein [Ancylomarina sp. DW003]